MQPVSVVAFNYSVVSMEKAAAARAAAERIRGRMQLAAESIIEVGRELIEQKKALGHGNYLEWVEKEVGISRMTASKIVNVAERFGANVKVPLHLSFEALSALAAPSTPEPVREAVLERAASGERVTAKEIEALRRRLKSAEDKIAEKEAQRAAQESRANIAARQVDAATNRAMYAEADKERLASELESAQEEIARLHESDVVHVIPTQPSLPADASAAPSPIHTPEAARVRFHALAAQFVGFWNTAPIEWRQEFLLGRYFPDDLAEALNAA